MKIKKNISVLILLFVNFLFAYKYLLRYTDFGIYISISLFLFQLLVYMFSDKIVITKKLIIIFFYGLFILIAGLVIISHFAIPVESLNVDRWSVISSFLTEMYHGNYPYYAKSHMGNYPGPMPVYFLIAAPFQLLGELSVLSCLGYCILVIWLCKKSNNIEDVKFMLFYLFTALYLIWEITTRSNVLTFTVIVLLVLNEFTKLRTENRLKFYGLAILTGLVLSTRSIYILPYVIFFLSSLLNSEISFNTLFLFLSVSLVAFIATFVPLLYYFCSDFLIINPFIIQSSFLVPKLYTLIFILISIGVTFLVKNKADKFFFSGISLFVAILIYAIYNLIAYGFEFSFIDSKMDISYFIFCIPFLIKYLMENSSYTQHLKIAKDV